MRMPRSNCPAPIASATPGGVVGIIDATLVAGAEVLRGVAQFPNPLQDPALDVLTAVIAGHRDPPRAAVPARLMPGQRVERGGGFREIAGRGGGVGLRGSGHGFGPGPWGGGGGGAAGAAKTGRAAGGSGGGVIPRTETSASSPRSIASRQSSYSSIPPPMGSGMSPPPGSSRATRSRTSGRCRRMAARCPAVMQSTRSAPVQQLLRERLRPMSGEVRPGPPRQIDRLRARRRPVAGGKPRRNHPHRPRPRRGEPMPEQRLRQRAAAGVPGAHQHDRLPLALDQLPPPSGRLRRSRSTGRRRGDARRSPRPIRPPGSTGRGSVPTPRPLPDRPGSGSGSGPPRRTRIPAAGRPAPPRRRPPRR